MSLLEKVKNEMIIYFNGDEKRINHAKMVYDYALQILQYEDANKEIVLASAYLHDIGIHECERKYNSTGGKYQEIEGPPIAENILKNLNCDDFFITSICEIISKHHTLNGLENPEFLILYEADWTVNLLDDFKNLSKEKKMKLIDKNFKTNYGKEIAYRVI